MKEAIEQMTFSGAKEKYSLDFLDYYIDEIYQEKLITLYFALRNLFNLA